MMYVTLDKEVETLFDDVSKVIGIQHQTDRIIEECAELTLGLLQYRKGVKDMTAIREELVDVKFTTDYLKHYLERQDPTYKQFFEIEYARKVGKLQNYVNKLKEVGAKDGDHCERKI